MNISRILFYTIALDRPGSSHYRNQAHLLVASMLRSGFSGDIKIIHNGESEIFESARRHVEEIGVDLPVDDYGRYGAKYKVRDLLSVEGYDWVLFLDCDCLVMQPIDHWFEAECDVGCVVEYGRPIQSSQFHGYLTAAEMAESTREGTTVARSSCGPGTTTR